MKHTTLKLRNNDTVNLKIVCEQEKQISHLIFNLLLHSSYTTDQNTRHLQSDLNSFILSSQHRFVEQMSSINFESTGNVHRAPNPSQSSPSTVPLYNAQEHQPMNKSNWEIQNEQPDDIQWRRTGKWKWFSSLNLAFSIWEYAMHLHGGNDFQILRRLLRRRHKVCQVKGSEKDSPWRLSSVFFFKDR